MNGPDALGNYSVAGYAPDGYDLLGGPQHPDGAASSRYKGVSLKKGKWEAKVMVNRRLAYREVFDSEVDAAQAYDRAVRRLKPQEAASHVNFLSDVEAAGSQSSALDPTDSGQGWQPLSETTPTTLFDLHEAGSHATDHQSTNSHQDYGWLGTHESSGGGVLHSRMAMQPTGAPGYMLSQGQRRGMTKSSSVSTLLAATTLSENGGMPHSLPPCSMPASDFCGHFGSWSHGAFPGDPFDAPNMSAASLLLGADSQGRADQAGPPRSAAGEPQHRLSPEHAPLRYSGSPVYSPGQAEPTPRVSTTSDEAPSTSAPAKAAAAAPAKLSARSGSGRARRASARSNKDKAKEGGAEGKGGGGRERAALQLGTAVSSEGKSETEIQSERMQVYKALMLQQERLHEQMRAHQAQHEEQQKRAAQREAEKQGMPPTSGPLHMRLGQDGLSGSAPGPGLAPRSSGGSRGSRGGSVQHAVSLSSGMSGGAQAGGKMPRAPSEPHSLAAMGVAGMGGRHQPTTRGISSSCGGMRRVQSTHNFGHHSYGMPYNAMSMPAATVSCAMRASPSMPMLPIAADAHTLSHIKEEEVQRAPTPLSAMLLEDPDVANDDLLSLMKDLTDPGPGGFDLDLGGMPSNDPGGGWQQSSDPAGNGDMGSPFLGLDNDLDLSLDGGFGSGFLDP